MDGVADAVNQKDKSLSDMMISAAQCRGARAMIGWSQAQLAEAAKVSRPTLVDFERGARTPYANNLAAIRAALEAAGVIFTNGDEPGVKLRKAGE
jgi:transcriptional regulator with XRE-family HTH domain